MTRQPDRSTALPPKSDSTRWRAPRTALIVLTAAALALSSCSSSGRLNPTRAPTLSAPSSRSGAVLPTLSSPATRTQAGSTSPSEPAQTQTPIQTQTATQTETATQTDTQTQTPTATQTATQTATETQTATQTQTTIRTKTESASPTPTSSAASSSVQATAAASTDTGSSTPAWVWWLIGLILLALAIATALLLRRRSRNRAWGSQFTAAKGEVAWFARGLIPQLEQAPTAQQMVGAWTVETNRVVAVEDKLTTLQASALDDTGRRQAAALRDAVRAARTDLAGLSTAPDALTARSMASSAAARLEAALASLEPIARPPGAHA